jgi:CRISPR-associated protein Csx14
LVLKDQVTEAGKTLLKILEGIQSLPEPRSGECGQYLAKKEPMEAQTTREWAEKIARRFTFVTRIEDIGWREGQPKVKAESPNYLTIFVPGRRVRGIGLRLSTTAQTDGQLQRAASEVQNWIEREV